MYRFIILLVFSIFCLSLNSKAINPIFQYIKTPANYGLEYDSLNVTISDGTRLTCWLIKTSKNDSTTNTIIISGSDAGNMSYSLDIAFYINKNFDCNVILYDYRGFGTSSPFKIDKNILSYPEFLNDLNEVINEIKKNPRINPEKICLYGLSMGASLSISSASLRNDISSVFADSPYISQEQFCKNLNKGNQKNKIKYIDDKKLSPINVINNMPKTTKLMVISGQTDNYVNPDDILDLYNKCSSEKKSFWIAPNCNHLEALPLYSDVYLNLLKLIIFNN